MRKRGVLVISHGSREQAWVDLVDNAIHQLPLRGDLPVAASFLEIVEGRLIQDGLNQLESQGVTDILVIPLFVSLGSTHVNEIAYALGVIDAPSFDSDLAPFRVNARIHYGSPIDQGPFVAEMIWDKAKVISRNPEQEVLILIGHGSSYDSFRQRWEQGMSQLVEQVREIGGFAAGDYALLRPDNVRSKVEYWQKERGMQVIAAPFFLSEGYFIREVIPKRLEGLSYLYSGKSLLPHPLLTRWIGQQVQVWLNVGK
ncbi:CbiX/SirB N-terminal domain-containing protein [Paenibacillus sp.]|jgi:sirohydrochlorin ferrochelatase|uniref:sirohydrochlorin chelatase n=1 Tax=Paenibacillus sp. TaxID=58172 RepID=UPI0028294860|nr:CbiX/SirB N-terminal domain-containing protein [Paenibacillus sp.]MDR0266636.1 cobalamin biosynthesis protein CbiX [Paenibacillus sp.]